LEQIEFNLRDCIAATVKALAFAADSQQRNKVHGPRRSTLRVSRVSTKASEVVLHFIVSDTGVGIPAEKQQLNL
jgi:hypothetical protein